MSVRIAADVPDELATRLLAHARANDRTLAAELRRALRMYAQVIDGRSSVQASPPALSSTPPTPIAAA